jgi:hypothetical protein
MTVVRAGSIDPPVSFSADGILDRRRRGRRLDLAHRGGVSLEPRPVRIMLTG